MAYINGALIKIHLLGKGGGNSRCDRTIEMVSSHTTSSSTGYSIYKSLNHKSLNNSLLEYFTKKPVKDYTPHILESTPVSLGKSKPNSQFKNANPETQ